MNQEQNTTVAASPETKEKFITNDFPGILGPMIMFPEVAKPMNHLAQVLLVSSLPGVTLTRWEREYIAAEVSNLNETEFCNRSHKAAAMAANPDLVQEGWEECPDIRLQLLVMVAITLHVVDQAREVFDTTIQRCLEEGISKEDIHLAIAISSAFNMFNTYVKGLGNPGPDTELGYQKMGEMLVEKGYEQNFG